MFASQSEINAEFRDLDGWQAPTGDDSGPDFTQVSHTERLGAMKTCEESNGIAPCKIGEIVVEGAEPGRPVDVWRRDLSRRSAGPIGSRFVAGRTQRRSVGGYARHCNRIVVARVLVVDRSDQQFSGCPPNGVIHTSP